MKSDISKETNLIEIEQINEGLNNDRDNVIEDDLCKYEISFWSISIDRIRSIRSTMQQILPITGGKVFWLPATNKVVLGGGIPGTSQNSKLFCGWGEDKIRIKKNSFLAIFEPKVDYSQKIEEKTTIFRV